MSDLAKIDAVGETPIYSVKGEPKSFVFKAGMPVNQKIYEPAPKMYVSATALVVPAYTDDSQYRYIDSESIPFLVLPGSHSNGAKLGDVALVYNEATGDNCYAIYADVGPSSKIGEGSIRLAQALNIDPDPTNGGTKSWCVV